MKGLAKIKPPTAVVQVNSRYARKHYGAERRTIFDERIHDISRRLVMSDSNVAKVDD